MKNRKLLFPVLIMLLALMSCDTMMTQSKAGWEPWGPRVDEIIMTIRGSKDVAVVPGIGPQDASMLRAMPDLDIAMSPSSSATHLTFNMRRAPLDADPVRQAIACVVDRNAIVRAQFDKSNDMLLPCSTIVPPWSPYHNRNIAAFPYDPARSRQILDNAGYTIDPKSKTRIDPTTGKPMGELRLLTPSPDVSPVTAEIGKMIADSASRVGLPVKHEPMDFRDMFDKVDARDFDMYVLSWTFGNTPTYLADFFHSMNSDKHGLNSSGISLSELDAVLDDLAYALDFASARQAAMDAQVILAEKQPMVILYVEPRYDAFNKAMVTGYVSAPGYSAAGYDNMWTPLNIRCVDHNGKPIDGGAIRWALDEAPKNLNPVDPRTKYDREVLSKVYDKLIATDPATLEDVPGMAEKWDIDTWETSAGEKGTVITFYIRKGIKWSDGALFTADDVKFTLDYLRDNIVPGHLIWDLERIELIDKYTVKIYFNTVNYWLLHNINDLYFLPKHIWKDVNDWMTFQPWKEPHPSIEGYTKLVSLGPFVFKEYKPGEFVRLLKNPNYWRLKPAK